MQTLTTYHPLKGIFNLLLLKKQVVTLRAFLHTKQLK